MADAYKAIRNVYPDISSNISITTATDDTTLVTVKTNYTIFLQRVHVQVTGASAGKTWQIVDSAGTPIQLAGPFATDTDGSHTDVDFGPQGIPLTAAKNLVLDVSATGAAGWISWEGYQKLTTVAAA